MSTEGSGPDAFVLVAMSTELVEQLERWSVPMQIKVETLPAQDIATGATHTMASRDPKPPSCGHMGCHLTYDQSGANVCTFPAPEHDA